MPVDGTAAAYRAFIAAVNDTAREYLIVGDLAANFHTSSKRSVETLEVWLGPLKPGQPPASDLWANYFKHLGVYSEKADRMVEQFKVTTEPSLFGVPFDAAFSSRIRTEYFGQKTSVASGDTLVALKLGEAKTPEQVEAVAALLKDIRQTETEKLALRQSISPDDPGPRPKPYLVKPKL